MVYTGNAFKYGDNIDTDVLYPARYNMITDFNEMVKHALEDLDREFVKNVQKHDVIVAGKNFGCGSCREHALLAIKGTGISCIIARSFARVFYRSSINIGLPIIECPEAADDIKAGDKLEIDFTTGLIKNLTSGKEYHAEPFPPFIQQIIDSGGLIELTKKQLGKA